MLSFSLLAGRLGCPVMTVIALLPKNIKRNLPAVAKITGTRESAKRQAESLSYEWQNERGPLRSQGTNRTSTIACRPGLVTIKTSRPRRFKFLAQYIAPQGTRQLSRNLSSVRAEWAPQVLAFLRISLDRVLL
jgi:hypothetical protein